jgi:hypothetical protein
MIIYHPLNSVEMDLLLLQDLVDPLCLQDSVDLLCLLE